MSRITRAVPAASTRTAAAPGKPAAKQESAPNPLWVIAVAMGVFFALGVAIMAVG